MAHDGARRDEVGATTVLLQGGLNPEIPLGVLHRPSCARRGARFPQITPHFFSAPEIHQMAAGLAGSRCAACSRR